MYKVDVMSESDSGMANRLLERFYSDTTGLSYKEFKGLRTDRKFMKFDWIVFDEINFHTMTLMNLLEEVKNHTYYKDTPYFKKSVLFDGVEYQLGVGGIHSVDSGALFEATDDMYLIDADIKSMYPTLMINHNLYPQHLGGKFMKNYKDILDRRLEAKKDKSRYAENQSLKIVLNSTFGKTLNANHWLYDPMVAFRITVNGQLFMLMLIERLVLNGFKVISANTDGIICKVPKKDINKYTDICKQWEQDTRFELEYCYYKQYARRDVNNYIAQDIDDYIKTKGVFTQKISLSKGFDKPIISIALYEFFINNVPIEKTIREHTDIYDFCVAKKIDKKFTNEFHYLKDGKHEIETLQKSVRYYISTDGGTLLKTAEEVVQNYEANKRVTIFNDYFEKPMKDYNIDYGYYIHATQKIINEIINPQLSIWSN
jgi:DNA polymerase elongation subunit (family B)